MKLTHNQMLRLWMARRYNEIPRCDATVTRTDGIDLPELAAAEMRAWYLTLLDEAPEALLAPEEIASRVLIEHLPDSSAIVTLPAGTRRLLSLRLRGASAPCTIVSDPDSPIARRQCNPLTRNAVCHPVAVMLSPRQLKVWRTDPASEIAVVSATAAFDAGEDTYSFDPRALELISN